MDKRPVGPPSKYTDATLVLATEYLDKYREGSTKLPTIEELIDVLDITWETMSQWTKPDGKYFKPELSETIKKIKNLQKYRLQHLGLSKDYNASMPIILLKANHGMIETSRQEITGKDGKDLPTPILQVGTDVDEE